MLHWLWLMNVDRTKEQTPKGTLPGTAGHWRNCGNSLSPRSVCPSENAALTLTGMADVSGTAVNHHHHTKSCSCVCGCIGWWDILATQCFRIHVLWDFISILFSLGEVGLGEQANSNCVHHATAKHYYEHNSHLSADL